MLAVVGDGRSGDPLHERDDKRDVYEGEVSEVDPVSELVRRVDGVVDGTLILVLISYHIYHSLCIISHERRYTYLDLICII